MHHMHAAEAAACHHPVSWHAPPTTPVAPHQPWEAMGPAAPQHGPDPTHYHCIPQAHVQMYHLHATHVQLPVRCQSVGMQPTPPLYLHLHHGKPLVLLHHNMALFPHSVTASPQPMSTCTTCMHHMCNCLLAGRQPPSPVPSHPPWEGMDLTAPHHGQDPHSTKQHGPGSTHCYCTPQAHLHMHHMHECTIPTWFSVMLGPQTHMAATPMCTCHTARLQRAMCMSMASHL
jgi:hypothetical protein